jgi:hypothetical protein
MEKSNDILMPEFERLLREGHMVEFAPKGVSMRPFIEGGRDKVVLKACNEPQVGMIVLARINQAFVLHRIYKIRGKKIILQGDGNLTGQEVCKAEDIIGRVVRVKGKYGKRKRLTKGRLWRHLPLLLKKLVLKVYRICILLTDYED